MINIDILYIYYYIYYIIYVCLIDHLYCISYMSTQKVFNIAMEAKAHLLRFAYKMVNFHSYPVLKHGKLGNSRTSHGGF